LNELVVATEQLSGLLDEMLKNSSCDKCECSKCGGCKHDGKHNCLYLNERKMPFCVTKSQKIVG
jgi:hypothetical protein